MSVAIFLSYNNQEEVLQIPVNPESIEFSDGLTSKTYEVVGLGEINVIKGMKLQEYSFSSFFPAKGTRQYYNTLLKDSVDPLLETSYVYTPQKYVEYIRGWMASKYPARFTFSDGDFKISEAVSIEKFDWKEVAGSPGDIEYTLTLKKYVFYAPKRVTVVTNLVTGAKTIQQKSARPDERVKPTTHKLVAGENLLIVARKYLGNSGRWREIQKLNGLTDAQLKNLQVGLVLKLPT
ncbi:peptidoglycan-binding protein LysM [Cohnella abietis]|uniref:Peptidoglycan-binding protein LysM n=1 Tax=Cohnella abietis TaxID=2507935 RepID=A0A3T1D1W9_9BACL|nr:peptidoglycan-binding protein LysM [Cohnella abietis]BBI32048.1 peptidoglycan-binding protein LysM [Cohnella abietis]